MRHAKGASSIVFGAIIIEGEVNNIITRAQPDHHSVSRSIDTESSFPRPIPIITRTPSRGSSILSRRGALDPRTPSSCLRPIQIGARESLRSVGWRHLSPTIDILAAVIDFIPLKGSGQTPRAFFNDGRCGGCSCGFWHFDEPQTTGHAISNIDLTCGIRVGVVISQSRRIEATVRIDQPHRRSNGCRIFKNLVAIARVIAIASLGNGVASICAHSTPYAIEYFRPHHG